MQTTRDNYDVSNFEVPYCRKLNEAEFKLQVSLATRTGNISKTLFGFDEIGELMFGRGAVCPSFVGDSSMTSTIAT